MWETVKTSVAQGAVLRFGVFELNLKNRELRRKGLSVAIQPLAFNLLAMLVGRPDHLVTREEIREQLWPGEVCGDFNSRLNFVVGKLREALDDDADRPLYIKTVRGAGLVFIAPVTQVNGDQLIVAAADTNAAPNSELAANGRSSTRDDLPDARTVRRWPAVVAALGTASLLTAALLVGRRAPPTPRIMYSQQLTSDGWFKEKLCGDGHRLYFTEERPEGFTLVQLLIPSGTLQPIFTGLPKPEVLGCSAKNSELLVGSLPTEGPASLWIVPSKGGQARPLAINAKSAAWSPDGATLAYSVDNELYLANADGSGSRRLASLPGAVTSISFEPGTNAVDLGIDEANRGCRLWRLRTNGSSLALLFIPQPALEDCAAGPWTAGGHFLFRESDGGSSRLWSYWHSRRATLWRSATLAPVTDALTSIEGGPAISADGEHVFVIGSQVRDHLLRYNAALRQWKAYLPGILGNEADVSRDGAWVAYKRAPGNDLWIARSDGSSSKRLTPPTMVAELPRWSPDGRFVAFLGHSGPGRPWKAYVVPANGGEPRAVLDSDEQQGAPTWSRDGSRLIFGELLDDRRTQGPPVIHIVDLKTGRAFVLPDSEGLWTARWSPDGRYVAALTSNRQHLMLFDFRTQQWSELAQAGGIGDLQWSFQSDSVYYNEVSPSHGSPAVLRARIKDRRVEYVAGLTGKSEDIWLGLAPDGSPIIAASSGTYEIYDLDVKWP